MLASLLNSHPTLTPVVATWLLNNVATAAISSLPAPTKDSKPFYVWSFKFLNTVIGNIQRAKSTTLEQSPNWKDAVDAHLANMAGAQVPQNEPPAPPQSR